MFLKALSMSMVLSFLVVTACTKRNKLEYGLDPKDTLRVNLMSEPPTLDWSKSADTTSSMMITNIMDTLLEFNLADPELGVVPSLATEWTPSEHARIWTFTLRKGVLWTDGVEFTAQNIVDSWERLLNPGTASEYAYFLFAIKNGKAYNAGKIKDFKDVGVRVNDKGQIVVELEKPMSYFPMLMTHHCTAPIRKDVVDKFGDRWTNPENIQTLGAYKLKVWEHDKAIVLERNETYFSEKAKIKNVLAYMINEYSTALNLFDSGKLDFQETIPLKELPRYRSNPGFHISPSLSHFYLGFNVRKAPFDNPKIRKAFSMAVDRKQVTDLLAGGQYPLTGWIPRGMFGHDDEIGIKFDGAAAGKMLDEAGYKDRSKFPKISFAVNTNENHQRVAENVQSQLKKNLGINIELSNEEWKVYLNRLHTDPPNIFRMGWLADYPDPDNFMNLMTGYADNNFTGWKNKKYDDLVEAGATEIDKNKRRAIYNEAQKLLTETDAPVIPIFSDVRPVLFSERVQNLTINALNRWPFKGVSFK